MPSDEHEQVVAMMSGRLALEELSIEEQRAVMEASAEMFPAPAEVAATEIDAGGVTADWVSVEGSEPGRVVLYFHGGGYVMGSRSTHRGLAGRIARAARARVLLPDYRLAPEHPFPAALEDAVACWRWLLSEGHAPERTAIAGDSAGKKSYTSETPTSDGSSIFVYVGDLGLWAFSLDGEPRWHTEQRTEIIAQGLYVVISYDPQGNELWRMAKHSLLPAPSPFAYDGRLYLVSGVHGDRLLIRTRGHLYSIREPR